MHSASFFVKVVADPLAQMQSAPPARNAETQSARSDGIARPISSLCIRSVCLGRRKSWRRGCAPSASRHSAATGQSAPRRDLQRKCLPASSSRVDSVFKLVPNELENMYVPGTVSGNVRGVARNSTSSAQEQGALVRALLGNKGAIHTYTSSAQEISCLCISNQRGC